MVIEIGRAIEHLQNQGWRIAAVGENWLVRKDLSEQSDMDDEQLLCLAEIYQFERHSADE